MLIQVDVDSTLYDSDELFHTIGMEFGINWPTQYNNWFRAEDIGATLEQVLEVFKIAHSEKFALDNVPYPDAASTLKGIVDDFEDVEIAYVSDRNNKAGKVLKKWLDKEGFLNSPDQHVIVSDDKREWMKENRPDIVIDDRVRTILFSRYELGAVAMSIEHMHNVNLKNEAEGIYILPTWKDIDFTLRTTVIPELQKKSLMHRPFPTNSTRPVSIWR